MCDLKCLAQRPQLLFRVHQNTNVAGEPTTAITLGHSAKGNLKFTARC